MDVPTAESEPDLGEERARRAFGAAALVREAAWLGVTVATTLAAVGAVLRLWRLRLGVPLTYGGDTKLALSTVQTVVEKGWYLHADRLGAPLGQHLYDYPSPGDTLNMLELRFLTLFTSDIAVVLNLFYLLSFALIAATAFLVLRNLRISRPSSAALAVLYACLPFHFLRGQSHLFLSNYWVVPLSCLLVLRQFGSRPLLDLSRERLRRLRARVLVQPGTLAALGICLAAGLTGVYYAAFTVILLAVAGVVCALRDRRPGPVLASVALAAVVLGTVVASVVPTLLYVRSHGGNELVAKRAYAETEFYGFKLVNLLLPVGGHRLDAFADIRAETETSPVPGEGSESLGLVGAAGFLGLLVLGLTRMAGPSAAAPTRRRPLVGWLAVLTVAAVLMGTVAGFSAVVAAFGFTDLRGWNRISVVVGFLCLAAVGLALDRLLRFRGERRRFGLGLAHVVVAAVLAMGGVWDQTTDRMAPDHAGLAAAWDADRTFVGRVEQALGRGAEVFQLPYAKYPEIPPIVDMADYEHTRGYIHSETLRWSYGAMKGRPESAWQESVASQPVPAMVDSLGIVGFEAIWVDRLGYADRANGLVAELQATIGAPPVLVSPDDRFVVFDLHDVQRQARSRFTPGALGAARRALLRPLVVTWDEGFHAEERLGEETWHWAGPTASLVVTAGDDAVREARLRFGVTGTQGASSLELRWPGGSRRLTVTPERQEVELVVPVRRGSVRLDFESDAPAAAFGDDPRDLRFRLLDLSVINAVVSSGSG